jgi:hypothetical protein
MSAIEALSAARASGVLLRIDGDVLVLEASSEPPPDVLSLVTWHKAEVLALLASCAHLSVPIAADETSTQSAAAALGSDQPCVAPVGRVHDNPWTHLCAMCGRFGPFGYGVRVRDGQLGRWYCAAHRPRET